MTTKSLPNADRLILGVKMIAVLCSLLSGGASATSQPSDFELRSPKDSDHFEETRPLLFWSAGAGLASFSVYVDDQMVGSVQEPSGALPVLHLSLTQPLSPGLHHWYVKALAAKGEAVASNTNSFTIDPPTGWPAWAIGPFVRYGSNPILRPQGTDWESRNTYNPGVLIDKDRFLMLYRGQAKGVTSRVGYAQSADGVTFDADPKPVIDATEPFEQKYGCEDARLFKSGDTFYTFYTGNQGKGIALCEATSPDGHQWKKLGPVEAGTKNGALICDPHGSPIRINGKFAMFVGNSKFGVCYSDDLLKWGPITWIDMKLPHDWVRPFEPCVAVGNYSATHPDDIVLFIAGTLNGKGKWFYAISETLFSKNDLTTKVDQLNDCIMKPRETYESGTFKNCLWMNCIIQHDAQWMMYYGAGDRNIGLATAAVK